MFSICFVQKLKIIAVDLQTINFTAVHDTSAPVSFSPGESPVGSRRAQLSAAGRALQKRCNSAARSKACGRGAQKEVASEAPRPPWRAPRLWYTGASVGESGPAQLPARSPTRMQLRVISERQNLMLN